MKELAGRRRVVVRFDARVPGRPVVGRILQVNIQIVAFRRTFVGVGDVQTSVERATTAIVHHVGTGEGPTFRRRRDHVFSTDLTADNRLVGTERNPVRQSIEIAIEAQAGGSLATGGAHPRDDKLTVGSDSGYRIIMRATGIVNLHIRREGADRSEACYGRPRGKNSLIAARLVGKGHPHCLLIGISCVRPHRNPGLIHIRSASNHAKIGEAEPAIDAPRVDNVIASSRRGTPHVDHMHVAKIIDRRSTIETIGRVAAILRRGNPQLLPRDARILGHRDKLGLTEHTVLRQTTIGQQHRIPRRQRVDCHMHLRLAARRATDVHVRSGQDRRGPIETGNDRHQMPRL